jgi:hypothetical protein
MTSHNYECKNASNINWECTNCGQSYFPVFPAVLGNTGISRRPGKYEYFPLFCQP